MCNLINTYIHTYISMRVAQNDLDDRAGLRGYVEFNKYTYNTDIRIYIEVFVKQVSLIPLGRVNAIGIE